MPRIPTLVTDRLILRPPSPGDLSDLVALGADADVMRWIGSGQTQSASQAGYWLECMLADARHGLSAPGSPDGLPGWLVVTERTSQAFVGLAVLTTLPATHVATIGTDRCASPCVEIGFRLARRFWGRGYATESASALLRYAFDDMRLPQLVAVADVRNVASNRVLEKLGMSVCETYDLNGQSIRFRSIAREMP